jgi:hypothetical protein
MKPYKWEKQPWEKRKLEFDFTLSLATGDSVASVSGATMWSGTTDVSSEMISGDPSISSNKVYVTVYGGTDGTTYNLRLRVVTTNGDQIEDDLDVVVAQKGQ